MHGKEGRVRVMLAALLLLSFRGMDGQQQHGDAATARALADYVVRTLAGVGKVTSVGFVSIGGENDFEGYL